MGQTRPRNQTGKNEREKLPVNLSLDCASNEQNYCKLGQLHKKLNKMLLRVNLSSVKLILITSFSISPYFCFVCSALVSPNLPPGLMLFLPFWERGSKAVSSIMNKSLNGFVPRQFVQYYTLPITCVFVMSWSTVCQNSYHKLT